MKTKAPNLSETQAQREYRKMCEKELQDIDKRNQEELKKTEEEYLLK